MGTIIQNTVKLATKIQTPIGTFMYFKKKIHPVANKTLSIINMVS